MENKKVLNNEKGVAILMVMAVIALMTFLLVDFTFETKLNKIKAYNQIEKDQARMNAEAGINFGLAKLKLYQEGRNLVEKTESLKGVVNASDVEGIVTMPFVYPIPSALAKGLQAKTAIEEFSKATLLGGSLQLTVTPVGGFLNPNNMRLKKNKNTDRGNQDEQLDENGDRKVAPQAYIENKILETLTKAFNEKKEKDDEFDSLYGNLDPKILIKELKFYVNSPENFTDPEKSEVELLYTRSGITPKHAPMTSIEEMYLLEGWPDAMVELIKDRLATHEVTIIPVNKLTSLQLEILFPNITDTQKEEFFKYRDGDTETGDPPREFKNEAEFKSAITGNLGILTEQQYEERSKEFKDAGLQIGVAGKLYKIESIGEYNRAKYKITAFVDLPVKPQPIKKKKKDESETPSKLDELDEDESQDASSADQEDKEDEKKEKPKPFQLMNPRVVEIRLN